MNVISNNSFSIFTFYLHFFSPILTFYQYSGLMFLLKYLNDFQYSEQVNSDCKIKEGIALLREMLIWFWWISCLLSEVVTRSCSVIKMFLKISQNSQENKKPWGLRPSNLLKKRLRSRCFSMSFAKFLRIHFLLKHFQELLPYFKAMGSLEYYITVTKRNQTLVFKRYGSSLKEYTMNQTMY